MIKQIHLTLVLILFALCSLSAQRGNFVSSELLQTYDLATLNIINSSVAPAIAENFDDCTVWEFTPEYGVELHKLVYETINVNGETTIASGLVSLPIGGDCNFPMINYNHGTKNGGALSEPGTIADLLAGSLDEWFISIPLAQTGFIGILPDYVGYGESACTDFHGYNHKSLAKCIVDMIRATKQLCAQEGIGVSEELFITGYSEGGFAAMAATKEIQELHCDEMQVIASAPLSGAYNQYPLMRDTLLFENYSNLSNFTYFVYSANNICPDVLGGNGLSEAIQEPYASQIPINWNECNPSNDFSIYPEVGSEIVKTEYIQSLISNSCHPFNEWLRGNNLNDWIPKMPMRLYYTMNDEQVPYTNATTTAAWMKAQGVDIEAITLCGSTLTHSPFAIPSLIETHAWFQTFLSGECDYVAPLTAYVCDPDIPAETALCPTNGEAVSQYILFSMDNDEIIWEETFDNCDLGVTGIEDESFNAELKLLQNPVINNLNVEINLQSTTDFAIASIFDVSGRRINMNQFKIDENIIYSNDVSTLSNGIYFLQIQLKEGGKQTIKFIKS